MFSSTAVKTTFFSCTFFPWWKNSGAASCNFYVVHMTMHVLSHVEALCLTLQEPKAFKYFPSALDLWCINPLLPYMLFTHHSSGTNAVLPYRLFTHHSSGGSPTHSSAASNQQTPQSQIHIFPASHGMNAARFCSCCKHLVAHSACTLGDYALWLHVLAFSCMSWWPIAMQQWNACQSSGTCFSLPLQRVQSSLSIQLFRHSSNACLSPRSGLYSLSSL